MNAASYISIAIAAVFYVRGWMSIRTLVKEVNELRPDKHFTVLRWGKNRREAWRLHTQLYPSSTVRKQIVWNIGLCMVCGIGWLFLQASIRFHIPI